VPARSEWRVDLEDHGVSRHKSVDMLPRGYVRRADPFNEHAVVAFL
jgi:hypothetical protein